MCVSSGASSVSVAFVDRQANTPDVPAGPGHARRVQRLVDAGVSRGGVAVGVAGEQAHVPRITVAPAIAVELVEHVGHLASHAMGEGGPAREATGIERWTRLAARDTATRLRGRAGIRRNVPPLPRQGPAREERNADRAGGEHPSPRDNPRTL